MENGLRWHGFTIYHDGEQFVASHDASHAPVLEIGSQSVDRLLGMIDEHNNYIDNLAHDDIGFVRAPQWLKEWFENRDQLALSEDVSFFAGDLVVQRVDGDKVFKDFGFHRSDQYVDLIDKKSHSWKLFEENIHDMILTMRVSKSGDASVEEIQIGKSVYFFEMKRLAKSIRQSVFIKQFIKYHNPAKFATMEVIDIMKG